MEFIAVVLGLLLAWRTKLSNFHYDLHGDNRGSLAWAKSDRVNSVLARRANILFTTLSMHLHSNLAEAEHVPDIHNTVFDENRMDDPSPKFYQVLYVHPFELDENG
jgi:hypothetical protein